MVFASGSVTVTDPTLLAALRSDPGGFYTDLHTTKFPGGAVRAQLHLLNHPVATSGAGRLAGVGGARQPDLRLHRTT